MYTIKDVAKLAGVSITTVSRIMNNRGKFSDKTKETVFAAMEELHYQPNEIARSLGQSSAKIIGIIVPSTSFSLYGKLVSVIEQTAYANGFKTMVAQTFSDPSLINDYVSMLQQNMVDGIVLASRTKEPLEFDLIQRPVICVGSQSSDIIPTIRSDNYAAGSLAARHLISRGCGHIGYITGNAEGLEGDYRYRGLRDICADMGVNVHPYAVDSVIANRFDESGEIGTIAYTMFHENPSMDGLFAETDLLAMECIQTAGSIGYRIPDTLRVVGFGDLYTSKMLNPPLTTVREDVQAMGEMAVQAILDKIAGKPVQPITLLPVKLIERRTT